jgi:hypothetical protein
MEGCSILAAGVGRDVRWAPMGRYLHLSARSHLDVVPVASETLEQWVYPPFRCALVLPPRANCCFCYCRAAFRLGAVKAAAAEEQRTPP